MKNIYSHSSTSSVFFVFVFINVVLMYIDRKSMYSDWEGILLTNPAAVCFSGPLPEPDASRDADEKVTMFLPLFFFFVFFWMAVIQSKARSKLEPAGQLQFARPTLTREKNPTETATWHFHSRPATFRIHRRPVQSTARVSAHISHCWNASALIDAHQTHAGKRVLKRFRGTAGFDL